ncbi:MAG TPA: DsrE/DsrF/DrsH-like family protein [candidate division Zixibacteria bacterium]|nr:DsrE/DsrF/DrsH-like family protein [candidate division Zixibacteria bacterium]
MTTTITRPRPTLPRELVEGLLDEPVADEAISEPAQQPAREAPRRTGELLIICESGDLERTWATTILASSAAASGMPVSIFFTFWGFFPLVRPDVRITGTNWMQKMLSLMNRPGIDHLKLSRLNFLGMGPWMMKRLAKRYGVAQPAELLETARALGVRLIPCQMSMDMMGLRREDLIDGLEEPAGAATVLEMINNGATPLFI